MAGDVEKNPGPECRGCGKKLATNIRPVKCVKCGGEFHKSCTGLGRYQVEKRIGEGDWKCEACDDNREVTVEVNDKVMEEWKSEIKDTKCKACWQENEDGKGVSKM